MTQQTQLAKIGIVSGIGPLAGSDVLAKVLRNAAEQYGAIEDTEYPELVLSSHGIAGVDNTAALIDIFETDLITMVQQVQDYGATIIGIACNTAHVYLDSLKIKPGVTIVNLIDITSAVVAQSDKQHLLLTSNASKKQRLYPDYLEKHGASYVETTVEQQRLLDDVIGLVMAHKLTEAGKLFEQVLQSAHEQGVEAVVVGCTELPIALEYCPNTYGIALVDSNDELAKALLTQYYGQ